LFHNFNVFGSGIIHILYAGCAEIKKIYISGAKKLGGETTVQLIYMYRNNMISIQQGRKILWYNLILRPLD